MTYVVVKARPYEGMDTPDYAGPDRDMATAIAQRLADDYNGRYYTVKFLTYHAKGYLMSEQEYTG